MSDERLLERIRRGDPHAIDELYRKYRPRLVGFLSRVAPRTDNLDEIVNDTFLGVWQQAKSFRHSSKVSTWIFAIAYRIAMKSLRQHRRWYANAALADADEMVDPVGYAEQCDWLARGLAQLSGEHRTSLMLAHHQGYSVTELADLAQSPVGTIKARLFHARRKMRGHLLELGGMTA